MVKVLLTLLAIHQRFVPKGVGVRSLTPDGYAAAFDAIMPAAEHLVKQDVDAIMVIGTSLTFYRGAAAHEQLLQDLRTQAAMAAASYKSAQFNQGYSVIIAPHDGVVLRKLVEERELVPAVAAISPKSRDSNILHSGRAD